jgi:hypothetical protein
MTDEPPKNPYRYGPSRSELKVWLALGLLVLSLIPLVFWWKGIPRGPALAEVVILPGVVGSYLTGRSIKRLIRREHP